MNFFRQIDTEHEEDLERFQSIRFLSFFPVRDQKPTFSSSSLNGLYRLLTCPLCKDLLNSPVYLKCSHRFCRQCIEKHLRSSMKKSCPFCLSPPLSKRELRMDDVAIDFLDLLVQSFPLQAKNEENNRGIDGMREEGRIRKRQRKRPDTVELENQIELPKKRRRNPESQSIESQSQSGNQSSIGDTLNEDRPKVEYFEEKEQTVKEEQHLSGNLNFSTQGFPIAGQANTSSFLLTSQASFLPDSSFQPSVQPSLRQSFKKQQEAPSISKQSSYSSQLPSLPKSISGYFRLKLVPQPSKIFTPLLQCDEILCPSEAKVSLVFKFIARSLNISQKQVRLFVRDNGQFREVNFWQSLTELNRKYWLADPEIAMLSLQQMLMELTLSSSPCCKSPHSSLKALFFTIQFQHRTLPSRPRR